MKKTSTKSTRLKERLYDALISIVVGAIIMALSAFFQSLIDGLQNLSPEVIGGGSGTFTYLLKRITHLT